MWNIRYAIYILGTFTSLGSSNVLGVGSFIITALLWYITDIDTKHL